MYESIALKKICLQMFLKIFYICQLSNFKTFQILEAFWLQVALLQVDIRNSALEDFILSDSAESF